jgi:7-cyano-7-deazaguanine synthase in queuosine biosynthesis
MKFNKLIVTDGEIENFWFDNFFRQNYKSVVVATSSGTDSSLLLFFLMKFAEEIKSDIQIYPFIAVDDNLIYSKALLNVKKIIQIIKDMFPNPNLQDLEIFNYTKNNENDNKNKYIFPYREEYRKKVGAELILTGSTLNMPTEKIEINPEYRVLARDTYESHIKLLDEKTIPWGSVDKKFIAYQYTKYNLMENIFPLTESCISRYPNIKNNYFSLPCKECYWCQEKYWAFGMYDRGIQ